MTGKNRLGRLAVVLMIAAAVGMSIVVFSGIAYSFEDESKNFNLELRTNYYLNHEDYPILKYEFLVPLYSSDDSLLFFSPKYHEDTHDESHEWQLGLGYRHMILDDRLILGGNVYYDTRLSHTGNEFEQVGLGVEVMGEWFEMRANGYLSLSDSAVVDSRREYYFAERSLSYRDYARYEVPMSGFDAEVGFRLPYVSNYVETWVYGGGYYFEPTGSVGGSVDPMVGYQARVKVAPTDYLHLDFRVRDDNVRGTDYYGSVNVEVPFSIENLVAGKNPFEGITKDEMFEGNRELSDRLYAQVERDPDIITGLSGDEVTNNGVLQDLFYVDNTYTGGASDGSWSDPYTSIATALGVYNPASEVLFVLAGDTVAGYAGFTVSADNTTIWGQGYDIPGVGLPHGLSAAWPVINHAVTIDASNVEISGLKFTGINRNYAVRITDGSGFNLHHNYFAKSGTGHQYGIMAWNLTGDIGASGAPVVIEGNYFDIESTDFNYGYGILMGTSGTIYADITDNVMGTDTYKIHGDRGAFGIYLTSSAGGVETTITGNDMYCYADNIVRGINIISPNNVMGVIDGNNMEVESGLKIDGMFLRGYNGSVGTLVDPFSIYKNDMEVTGGTSFGVRIYANDIYAEIDDNILLEENGATGGSNSGIYEIAYTGNIGGSISGNTLDVGGDTAFGVYVRTDGSGSTIGEESDMFDMSDNVIDVDAAAGGGYGGILYADGDIFASIIDNDLFGGITGTTAYGLYLGSVNGGLGSTVTPLEVIDNDFSVAATTGDGYGLYCGASINIFADISGNDMLDGVTGVNAYGMYINSNGGNLGSATNPIQVMYNDFSVTATTGAGYGMYYGASSDIFADISKNDLLDGVTGVNAYGTYISSVGGNLGSVANPLEVIDNDFYVTATTGDGYGLYLSAPSGTMDYTITQNHIYAYSSSGTWDLDNLGLFDPVYIKADVMNGVGSGTLADPYSPQDGFDAGGNIYALDTGGTYTTGGLGFVMNVADTGLFAAPGDSPVFSKILRIYQDNTLVKGLLFDHVNTGDAAAIFLTDVSGTKIWGNSIDVTSNTFEPYGIFADTTGGIGTQTDPIEITNNVITVNSDNTSANGISLTADLDMFAEITNNDMSGGITGLDSNTYGIRLAADNLTATIIENNLAVSANDTNVYGIYFNSATDSYSYICDNVISVESSAFMAYGIRMYASTGNIFSQIIDNDIDVSGNTNENYNTVGIYLFSSDSHIGGYNGNSYDPIEITGNTIDVQDSGDAYGIILYSHNGLTTADIQDNVMNVTTTGAGSPYYRAVGLNLGYLSNTSASIGDVRYTRPVTFKGNTGTIDSSSDPSNSNYMIYVNALNNVFDALVTGECGDPSWMGRNTFTAGHWDGNSGGDNTIYLSNWSGSLAMETYISPDVTYGGSGTHDDPFAPQYGLDQGGLIYALEGISTLSAYSDSLTMDTPLTFLSGAPDNEPLFTGGLTLNAVNLGVSNLNFDVTGSTGAIAANNAPFFIRDNVISSDYYGIYVNKLGNIANFSINGNDFIIDGTGTGLTSAGIYFYTSAGITDGQIYRNTCSVVSDALALGFGFNSPGGDVGLFISENQLGEIDSGGNAYAMFMGSGSDILTSSILNNTFGEISGDNIYGIAIDAVNNVTAEISNNVMSGNITGSGDVFGLSIESDSGDIVATITNNVISGTITGSGDAYGMFLSALDGDIDATIDTNEFDRGGVTSGTALAAGIYMSALHNIVADVTDNVIISHSLGSGGVASGIYLITTTSTNNDGSIGAYHNAVDVSNNTLDVTSDTGNACGIGMVSYNDIYANIEYNEMDVSGLGEADGVYLDASISGTTYTGYIGFDGSSIDPVAIGNNTIVVYSDSNIAYGVNILASAYHYSSTTYNSITVTSNSLSHPSVAAYLHGDAIGWTGSATPTLFQNNTGTVDGAATRYMLVLNTDYVSTGNYVHWGTGGTANTFKVENGGAHADWSGNYEAGETLPQTLMNQLQPVYTNFGSGDTLTP